MDYPWCNSVSCVQKVCVFGFICIQQVGVIWCHMQQRVNFDVCNVEIILTSFLIGGLLTGDTFADEGLPAAILHVLAGQVANRQPVRFSIDMKTASLTDRPDAHVRQDRSWLDEEAGLFHFFQPAPPRLVIVGAVHITQHLAAMAAQTGFQVVVVDPRAVFASQQRFGPEIDLHLDWPSDYLANHHLDPSTALVTLTHDPKIDDDALVPALAAPLFYRACLGSKRTHEKRLSRLREAGATEEQLADIQGPAGLSIGAKTPAEIAVSILAQLIAAWRAGPGARPLPKKGPDV